MTGKRAFLAVAGLVTILGLSGCACGPFGLGPCGGPGGGGFGGGYAGGFGGGAGGGGGAPGGGGQR